jgi:hypothetical protein
MRWILRSAVVASATLLFVCGEVRAQPQNVPPRIDFRAAAQPEQPKAAVDFRRAAVEAQGSAIDPADQNLRLRELEGQVVQNQWAREFTRYSYWWHFLSTIVIFAMVIGIVAFGLRLTWLQFTRESRIRTRASDSARASAAGTGAESLPATPSTVKIGPAGIEITSQVIGLLILALSVGFFYLYARYIYPITEDSSRPEPAAQSRTAK